MIKSNPSKIKQTDIIVGIPTYNESDNIGFVVKQVSRGLEKYFPRLKKVIIDVDNNSPDNTKRVFFSTPTKVPKIYISTPPNILGKGNNICNLFGVAKELEAKIVIIIDADLKSITPTWIKHFGEAVEKGYDYVLPLYSRNEYDGSITNHICYPLVYGLLGINVRQPIGGEFAFSRIVIEHLLKQKWDRNTKQYGIDIFLTLNSIFGGFKLVQVNLKTKVHKPSTPKLGPMFSQVTNNLFRILLQNKTKWQKSVEVYTPPVIEKNTHKHPQRLPIDYKDLKERALYEFSIHSETLKKILPPDLYKKLTTMYFQKKRLNIGAGLWTKILYEMFYNYLGSKSKVSIVKALRPLYFGRTISFIKKTLELGYRESEREIQNQAKNFYRKRNYLLKKLSAKG